MRDAVRRLFRAAGIGDLKDAQRAIAEGAQINLRSDWGSATPLVLAAFGGHHELVSYLLNQGADATGLSVTSIDYPPLKGAELGPSQLPRKSRNQSCACDLHAALNTLARLPDSPLGESERDSEEDLDGDLIDGYPDSPMAAAARVGSIPIMQSLHAAGAALAGEDELSEIPLAAAAFGGHLKVCEWLLAQDVSCLGNLVSAPLHAAAAGGNAAIVRLFLALGLDPNHPEAEDGYTPLHEAATAEVARVLIEAGADVDRYVQGDSPMSAVGGMGNWQLFELLAEHSTDEDAITLASDELTRRVRAGSRATHTLIEAVGASTVGCVQRRLLQTGVKIDGYDVHGTTTALLAACLHLRPQIVGLLLEAGADPNVVGLGSVLAGKSPLMALAANAQPLEEARVEVVLAIASALRAAGALLDVQDCEGNTALHHALAIAPLWKLLRERGADASASTLP